MRPSQSPMLLVAATTAFAMNSARDLYPYLDNAKPFQAPRWNSPVPSSFVGQPCEYNSDYDHTTYKLDLLRPGSPSEKQVPAIRVRTFPF